MGASSVLFLILGAVLAVVYVARPLSVFVLASLAVFVVVVLASSFPSLDSSLSPYNLSVEP